MNKVKIVSDDFALIDSVVRGPNYYWKSYVSTESFFLVLLMFTNKPFYDYNCIFFLVV